MRFECGDLERALAVSDLMPEAREHLKTCAACRREYRLWTEISSSARELHQEWDSAHLWPKIRQTLEAEKRPDRRWWRDARLYALAAAALALAILVPLRFAQHSSRPAISLVGQAGKATLANQDFLTEQALEEVEKNEAAYRQSIDKLSRLAEPKLESAASPAAASVREKLLLLDSAIADTRSNVASNRFNVSLQMTLAGLYREKQQTLQELLAHDRKN